jgi:hypothetical protein
MNTPSAGATPRWRRAERTEHAATHHIRQHRRDAVLRSTNGGDQVLSFSVGVRQGFKDGCAYRLVSLLRLGQARHIAQGSALKGVKVFVAGELTIGEYQDKPQYDLRVSEVDFVPRGDVPRQQSSADPFDDD